MRIFRSRLLAVGVVAIGTASTVSAQANSAGFCRRAPVLASVSPQAINALPGGARLIRASLVQDTPRPGPDEQICPDGSIIPLDAVCPPAPPPPPPPPAAPMIDSDSAIVVTGTRVDGARGKSSYSESVSVVGGRRLTRQGSPPAGLLTAGDHDDLLNPELFALYLNESRDLEQRLTGVPLLDTRRAITVEVRDERGRPAPLRAVRVECSDGNRIELSTLADGRAVFFPEMDALSDSIIIEVAGDRRTLVLPKKAGTQLHRFVVAGDVAPVTKLDLMVVLDCTGSMSDEIAFLKSDLRAILEDLKRRHPQLDLRVGLVAYRDIGDEFVTRSYRLTDNLDALQSSIAAQTGNGGGDMPEAVDQALSLGVQQDWRDDALHSMLWVADAPPHDDKIRLAFDAAEVARAKRIQIVPVASSGVDDAAEYFMRASAAITQSRYVFLTDDSGIGNPHAEPEVACYVVTSLASTIRRVLDSQLSGRRIEPANEEVIRVNGVYDHGKCDLPPGFSTKPRKGRRQH